MMMRPLLLLILLALATTVVSLDPIGQMNEHRKQRAEEVRLAKEEAEKVVELKKAGHNEVGHTAEAALLRKHQLRKKRRKGLLRRKERDLASVLFPGVSPEVYMSNEEVLMYTDHVNSKKTQVPFEFYELPGCPAPKMTEFRRKRQRKNLGARLQGIELKPAPYTMKIKEDILCTPLCQSSIDIKKLRWLRKLVERQYRIHMTLDTLPVLMRSQQLNYAVRGYPIGFMAPPSYTGLDEDEYYLYNHLKFTITYSNLGDSDSDTDAGVHITGFDVHPISITHEIPGSGLTPATEIDTCNAEGAKPVANDPATYLKLKAGTGKAELPVIFSYEVEWVETDLPWEDRWDVYLIGSPDDDIHSFAIINSLMIVLFLTGAIATILIRTLKKDIAGYNDIQSMEEAQEETGWKLVHGDVFRPPSTSPMLFSILVGTGVQVGFAFLLTMLGCMVRLINPMHKGQTLTGILVLYVLCGSVAGYVSARIFKFCGAKAWKRNMILTAAGLPGVLVGIFMILNFFLHMAGAATAVGFFMILAIFALWVCVSTPLVFVGSFMGFRAEKISVPAKVNKVTRYVPMSPWYSAPPISFLLGGILPFGSVCIELFFILSALWLHQIYYFMGVLAVVILILSATCAEVSIAMTYLQLCAEDHRWYWKSFWNCASAGLYLFLYSLWFLSSRLQLVGVLPVMVFISYMGMISICFALFCGSMGVMCSFVFVRAIYGALKVD